MNFISKLIITVIVSLIVAVTMISIKLYDIVDTHTMLSKKVENVDHKLDQISIKNVNPNIKYQSFGIDVSHWNGDIVVDIPSNDDISFVICKATQGKGGIDPEFKMNWTTIKEMKKIRGAYHFYMYSDAPEEQANHFCEVVNDLQSSDMSLILDIEELSLPKSGIDASKLKEDVMKFLAIVESKIGRIPILYTDFSFANRYLNDVRFSKYPLWLAEYSNAKSPTIPFVWKEKGCMIWQKKDNYNINSTKEDFDVFFGKKEDLVK